MSVTSITPNSQNSPISPNSSDSPTHLRIDPQFAAPEFQGLIEKKGEEILRLIENQSKVSIFNKTYWYGSIMDWSMKNETFKTNMFRFVDVLPVLQSGSEVAKHLKEYFANGGEEMPSVFNVGLGLGSLAPGLMAGAIRKNVTQMAKMFITGENAEEAIGVIKKSRKNKIAFTVDILGEATLSEKEATEYSTRYLELIQKLSKDAKTWDDVSQIDRDETGAIPKINVSIKLTALYSQINDRAWDQTKQVLKDRLLPLLHAGMECNAFINLDMEQYAVKHLTLEVFKELLMEPAFKNYSHFGCVIQAYLRDSFADIQDLVQFARTRGTPFSVRLVKGAYWDFETIEAAQRGWPVPVYTIKAESDANYEHCARYLLDNHPQIRVALASHNVRSLAAALVYAESKGLPKTAFEIQMLYGMADPIKKSLVDLGYRVREYAPVGDLIPGMAYLVRRLLENTSNESWLRGKFSDNKNSAELLRDPLQGLCLSSSITPKKAEQFYNEPLLDFAVMKNRESVLKSLSKFKAQLPIEVWPIVDNQIVKTGDLLSREFLNRENPSQKNQVVAKIGLANIALAEKALQSSVRAFANWRKQTLVERAAQFNKLADLMERDRFDLIAQQVLEVGKPWTEADGDVAEAIDFCRYYAREALNLKAFPVGHVPGENSLYQYRPRGVTLVIAPWNFPLAILTGMVAAATVAGNTVIMKPAEQSSWIAGYFMQLIQEVGFPAGVIQFLPGLGEVVGEYLVAHADVSNIAFTGSKAVGLHILKTANTVTTKQKQLKRCIVEMGGKNAIIVYSDADLDEAVDGVLYSAFGFAGQKCSAASRVIVLEEIYDRFVDRLVEAASNLKIRSSEDPEAYLGPVVSEESLRRIEEMISIGEKESKLLFKSKFETAGNYGPFDNGHFAPIAIFGPVAAQSRLAQEEIFGPVLAVIKAKDLDEALRFANEVEYALTGGFYSRSPANIARVREELEVGNMYINRGITGAMVERHPFGGFKMSGLGSKTGGPDYLRQFTDPICVTENTLRRGFAPNES